MKQYEEWLIKAESDLKTAKKLISGDDPILDTATYHTQQCAEKALKAYLSFKQQPIVKIHDLGELVEICIGFPEKEDVEIAIEKAEKILKFVKEQIERELQ